MLCGGNRARMQARYDELLVETDDDNVDHQKFSDDAGYRCEMRKKIVERIILYNQLNSDPAWMDMRVDEVFRINGWPMEVAR